MRRHLCGHATAPAGTKSLGLTSRESRAHMKLSSLVKELCCGLRVSSKHGSFEASVSWWIFAVASASIALNRYSPCIFAALTLKNTYGAPTCLRKSISSPPRCHQYARVPHSLLLKTLFAWRGQAMLVAFALVPLQFYLSMCRFLSCRMSLGLLHSNAGQIKGNVAESTVICELPSK